MGSAPCGTLLPHAHPTRRPHGGAALYGERVEREGFGGDLWGRCREDCGDAECSSATHVTWRVSL